MSCLIYSRYRVQQKQLIASRQWCDEAVKINSYPNVVKTMFANNSLPLFTLSVQGFSYQRVLTTCTCVYLKGVSFYSYFIGRISFKNFSLLPDNDTPTQATLRTHLWTQHDQPIAMNLECVNDTNEISQGLKTGKRCIIISFHSQCLCFGTKEWVPIMISYYLSRELTLGENIFCC